MVTLDKDGRAIWVSHASQKVVRQDPLEKKVRHTAGTRRVRLRYGSGHIRAKFEWKCSDLQSPLV